MEPTSASLSSSAKRLTARLQAARDRSRELFAIVRPEALYDRPIPERHRIIFYLGHLEAFDWNLLREPLNLASFDPGLDKLFSFGIDPVDGGLPADQPKDWPSLEQIRLYAALLREKLDERLAGALADDSNLVRPENGRLLEVAIEHRLMHAETLSYMLHQLPLDRKFSRTQPASPVAPRQAPRMAQIPAGVATLGLWSGAGQEFGWDNEFPQMEVEVPAFAMDTLSVTNQDYLQFMREGGYADRALWSEAGWDWISSSGRGHPAFWIARGPDWVYRTMFEEIPLPPDWPVYVSHEEASAYARWAGKELPSEAEWHRAAVGTRAGSERTHPWGSESPSSRLGNFDFHRWDPVAAGSYPAGASDFGVADLVGNGWEWTRTPFAPFPGFEAFPFYRGYSADFFDGKHFVMKGGSPRTAACMLRRSFRNWFQPRYPYVYAKFRCVDR
jgi:gamma-glutamyl hercynylcysteine S-oxide synthase